MKLFVLLGLFSILSLPSFGQDSLYSLNDENFREAVEEGINLSELDVTDIEIDSFNIKAFYESRSCILDLSLKYHRGFVNYAFYRSFAKPAKSLEKCQNKMIKFLKKNLPLD